MNRFYLKKFYWFSLTSSRGFTLVEMMVTVLLFSVISAAIYSTLLSGMHSMEVTKSRVELQQDFRLGMERMKSDLRQASMRSVIDVPADDSWYTSVTFRVSEGASEGRQSWPTETIQYFLSGSTPNQLHRKVTSDPVDDKIVAENISTLKFRRETATPNIMEVSMSGFTSILRDTNINANATISVSSTFKVLFRN